MRGEVSTWMLKCVSQTRRSPSELEGVQVVGRVISRLAVDSRRKTTEADEVLERVWCMKKDELRAEELRLKRPKERSCWSGCGGKKKDSKRRNVGGESNPELVRGAGVKKNLETDAPPGVEPLRHYACRIAYIAGACTPHHGACLPIYSA
ncbi:hypothetical protein FB451DRAFT_1164299 [Mycena latifolia]|nr:hypothetical protein FB451DRAFT_1164299 [Mycena latifolia]